MTNDILTEPEACELLRLSRSTLHRLRDQDGLPFLQVGRSVRYSRQQIETWLQQKRVEKSAHNQ